MLHRAGTLGRTFRNNNGAVSIYKVYKSLLNNEQDLSPFEPNRDHLEDVHSHSEGEIDLGSSKTIQ
jgi:hypothetical protein